MAKEERVGAQGVSNNAQRGNQIRYQVGRAIYHLKESQKFMDPAEDAAILVDSLLEEVQELHDLFPLTGGTDADTLGVKGKKAKAKAAEGDSDG